MGAQMVALSEGMALAEKCDLDQVTLLELRFRTLKIFEFFRIFSLAKYCI